jgi:prephenate dehydratase
MWYNKGVGKYYFFIDIQHSSDTTNEIILNYI